MRPNPNHNPTQAITSSVIPLYRGPSKFKSTANHNEGKIRDAKPNRKIIDSLSLVDFSFRSNIHTNKNTKISIS